MSDSSNVVAIVHENKEYALLINMNELPTGLTFYTPDDKFVQVASWKYDKGHTTKPHSHKVCERISSKTQEFVYVKKGKLEVTLYSDESEVIAQKILDAGMSILIFSGGHKYRILKDSTEVLEVKNGPYPGLEKDKELINDA